MRKVLRKVLRFLLDDLSDPLEPDQFVRLVRKAYNRFYGVGVVVTSLIGLIGWLATGSLEYFLLEILWLLGWIANHCWVFGFSSTPDPKRVAKRLGKWLEQAYGTWDRVKRPDWVDEADRMLMAIESGKTYQSKSVSNHIPKHE